MDLASTQGRLQMSWGEARKGCWTSDPVSVVGYLGRGSIKSTPAREAGILERVPGLRSGKYGLIKIPETISLASG